MTGLELSNNVLRRHPERSEIAGHQRQTPGSRQRRAKHGVHPELGSRQSQLWAITGFTSWASDHRTLSTGVTNDLERRLFEHREGLTKGLTKKYNINRLVYFEEADDPMVAIEREKQIKSWDRAKRVALIERRNPEWKDLSEEW